MIDYRQIVSDLRVSLTMDGHENVDFLRAAASDYMVACDTVNQRLGRCASLLQRGEVSEALRLCEIEPNLLEVLTVLDFPERAQWEQHVSEHGVSPPPPLAVDVAAELNGAYLQSQPVAALMNRHRRLAIRRAPIKTRLEVLRQLADKDTVSSWGEDVKEFEKERLKELVKDVTSAAETKNAAELASLDDELRSSDWTITPPPALLRKTTEARRLIYCEAKCAELERIEPELSAAFAGGDLDLGRELREQWDLAFDQSGLPGDHPLAVRAAPALQWLSDQDAEDSDEAARVAATTALSRALDRHLPRADLFRLYQAAHQHEGAVSIALERRYQEQLLGYERSQRRKQWLFWTAIVLAGVLAAGGISLGVRYYKFLQDRDAIVKDVEQKIKDGKLVEARSDLKQLSETHPEIAQSDAVVEVTKRVVEEIAKEKSTKERELERHRLFVEHVRVAADDAGKSLNPGILTSLRAEAVTPEERLELERKYNAFEVIRTSALRSDLGVVQKEFEGLTQTRLTDAEYIVRLATIRRRVESLKTGTVPVEVVGKADDALSQIEERRKLIQSKIDQTGRRQTAHERADQLVSFVGNVDTYRAQLQAYANDFGDLEGGKDYQLVVPELELIPWLNARNDVIAKEKEFAQNPDPESAEQISQLLGTFLKAGHEDPETKRFVQRMEYLKAIAARRDNGVRIEVTLGQWFQDPLKSNCLMTLDTDKHRYYYLQAQKKVEGANRISVYYLNDFNGNRGKARLSLDQVVSQGEAPQDVTSKGVLEVLQSMNDSNWEPKIVEALSKIEAQQGPTDIDPILKLLMLRQTLTVACKGGFCLRSALDQQLKTLASFNADDGTKWFLPDDAQVATMREDAASVLSKLGSLKEAATAAGPVWKECHGSLGSEYDWIGVLRKNTDGTWTCQVRGDSTKIGPLFVMLPSANGKVMFEEIGRRDNRGTISIKADRGIALLQGRPVLAGR